MTRTRCTACGTLRSPGELLAVTEIATGAVRCICRHDIDARCFASVRSAAAERIALADSTAARLVDRAHTSAPAPAGTFSGERRPDPPRLPGTAGVGGLSFLPPAPATPSEGGPDAT